MLRTGWKERKKKHLDAEAIVLLFFGLFILFVFVFVSDFRHQGLTGGQEPAGASSKPPPVPPLTQTYNTEASAL